MKQKKSDSDITFPKTKDENYEKFSKFFKKSKKTIEL